MRIVTGTKLEKPATNPKLDSVSMNTFPETSAGQVEAVGCAVVAPESNQGQYRYSVASFNVPFSSSSPLPIHSLNPYLESQPLTLTSNSPLTHSELKAIEAEYKDVELNGYDDNEPDEDDEPEDGSLVTDSNPMKGNDHVYSDPLLTANVVDGGFAEPYTLTEDADVMDADSDPGSDGINSTGQVLKSEIYNNPGSSIGNLDAIFNFPVLGPSVTSGAVEVASPGVTGSGSSNASCSPSRSTATGSNSFTNSIVPALHQTKEIVEDEPIRDFSKLNRINCRELSYHEHLLSITQRNCLSFIKSKVTCWPDRFREPNQYLRQSQLLLLTHGWASADRYCRCCVPNKKNPGGECKLHRFCPYCSWREGHKAALTYVPRFDDGNWHFLTGSFKCDLTMNTPADVFDWLHYWDAYLFGLKELVKAGDVRGVYLAEELAVNSMLPVHVLPHVHCVIEADEVGEDVVAKLQQLVSQHLAAFFKTTLVPNTKLEGIQSAHSLFHRLRYMFKPINFVKAYENAWPVAASYNRHLAQQLNNQMTDLVMGYSLATNRRNKMTGFGNLSAKTRSKFIGIKKANHDKHRDLVKRITELPPEYVDVGEVEEMALTA